MYQQTRIPPGTTTCDGSRLLIELQWRKKYFQRFLPFLLSWMMVLASLLFVLEPRAAVTTPAADDPHKIEHDWGVQIVGIRPSAAGHMLDFRYRVIDAQKAAPLFARQTRPYLIDQQTGKSLVVPNMAKVGPLRTSDMPQAGRTYWMFFGNPGLVKSGAKVSVVIGDFKVENLVVQ